MLSILFIEDFNESGQFFEITLFLFLRATKILKVSTNTNKNFKLV